MPTVSKDGKTVTVHLRNGVRFSPPVNREVTSADVKYAIERGFATSVSNGYVGAYFGDIVGAPAKATKPRRAISGIQTPNTYTIVFRLKQPVRRLRRARSAAATAPVPRRATPSKFDSQTPVDVRMHQVATGPYMIKNDASGNINGVGYQPGKLIELVRNPNWNAKTSWRPAYADEILFKEGFQDPTVKTQDDPERHGRRERRHAAAGRRAPLDPRQLEPEAAARLHADRRQPLRRAEHGARRRSTTLDVRKAVAYVLDKNAMRLTRGGRDRRPHRDALHRPELRQQGLRPGRRVRVRPVPERRQRRQRRRWRSRCMRKAGYPNGMYTGPQVTQVADNTSPGSNTARRRGRPGQDRLQGQDDLGHALDDVHEVLQRAEARAEHLPERRLAPRLPRAADDPRPDLQRRRTSRPVNNSNWPQLNDPRINKQIAAAERIVDPEARYAAWGRIDDEVTRTAAARSRGSGRTSRRSTRQRVTHASELWNGGARTSPSWRSSEPVATRRVAESRRPPAAARGGRRRASRRAAGAARSTVRYVVRRILWAVVLLLVVSALTFVIFYRSRPPTRPRCAPGAQATPELIAQIRHALGPRPGRSTSSTGSTSRRSSCTSTSATRTRTTSRCGRRSFARLPATISLTRRRVRCLAARSGSRSGIFAAIRPRSPLDRAAMGGALVADLGAGLLARTRRAVPVRRATSARVHLFDGPAATSPFTQSPGSGSTSLFCRGSCSPRRSPRSTRAWCAANLIEVLGEDYIRTARAKGLRERGVISRHGLRAALTPVVTIAGLDLGHAARRRRPHRDRLQHPGHRDASPTTRSINADLPAIQGTVLFGALFIIVANIVVDILYAFLDPRVRY